MVSSRSRLAAALMLVPFAGPALAECDVEGISAARDGGIITVTGSLATPTPGFSSGSVVIPLAAAGNPALLDIQLALIAPAGAVPQVIDQVAVDIRVDPASLPEPRDPAGLTRLQLLIDKPFDWGPERILCDLPPAR